MFHIYIGRMLSWLTVLIVFFGTVLLYVMPVWYRTQEPMTSGTTVYLLGDSVLNNARYVPPTHSVEAQLQQRLAVPLKNLAEDGAKIQDLEQQMAGLEASNVQHAVLSIGGNNILAGDRLTDMQQQMEKALAMLLTKVPANKITLLAVYKPHDPMYDIYHRDIQAWNAWLRQHSRGITVVDLMYFLRDPDDFAYVEPSWQGSAKIANALVGYLSA